MAQAKKFIWFVCGPSGSGKSTHAVEAARSLSGAFIEGDSLHPTANVEKMSQGIPLEDSDRWGWLTALRSEALATVCGAPRPQYALPDSPNVVSSPDHVVVACSALKKVYRDVLAGRSKDHPVPLSDNPLGLTLDEIQTRFIFLNVPLDVARLRMTARSAHFFKPEMVLSQYAIYEVPDDSEPDCFVVTVTSTDMVRDVQRKVTHLLQQ